jgi:mannan endo-1,4-beta-mannosidase
LVATSAYTSNNTSGAFQIVGSKIIGPDGNQFIPKGVNVSGMKWGWPGNPVSHVNKIVDDWGFNLIRVNCRMYDYYWDGKNVSANSPFQTISDMQIIVEAFTTRNVVVMFEFHDATGSYYEGDRLYDLMDAWRDIIALYGDNPYVWYNIMNEPGGEDSPQRIEKWVSMHQQVIEVIRDEQANKNIIVADAHFWGQDAGTRSSDPVVESNSSILSAGDRLINFNGKTYENIMFSFHTYDQWNVGGIAQLSFRLHDFIERINEKGMAVMIGEFGTKPAEGHLYFPKAFQVSMDVASAHGTGLVWWHWYGGDNIKLTTSGNGGGSHINNSENPTNLTWAGQQIWDNNHFEGNRYPFVTLYSPGTSQLFKEGEDLVVKSVAADIEDGIKEVRLYIDGQLFEIKTETPYQFTVPSIGPGRYLISTHAEDHAGNVSVSELVAIDVNPDPSGGSVLFITGDGELSVGDQQLYNQILKEGYTVYHKRQDEVAALHANRRVAIVISGTATADGVGNLFVNSSIPLIAGNSNLFPVLKMTGPSTGTDFGTVNDSIVAVNSSSESFILDGFSEEIDIYDQASVISFGVPGTEAEIILIVRGDDEKAVLFLYSAGSNMFDHIAPAGRVGWYGKLGSDARFTESSLVLFGRVLTAIISGVTSINGVAKSQGFSLKQNYPNPFMNSTTIEYVIENEGTVCLEVIDLNGKVKEVLVNKFQLPGNYRIKYIPRDMNTFGPLIYRISMNGKIITRTMIAYK